MMTIFTLLKKELKFLCHHWLGTFGLGVFLCICASLLWFVKGDWYLFGLGFADLTPFFDLSSWLLCILIPALGMQSFTEEHRSDMLMILRSKSVAVFQLFLSKVLAQIALILLGLLLTLFYVFTMVSLSLDSVDIGVLLLSYGGLFLMAIVFVLITAWVSAFCRHAMMVFLWASLLCLFGFYGFQYLGSILITTTYPWEQLGFYARYQNFQKGLLSVKDLFYFLGLIGAIAFFTLLMMGAFPTKTKKYLGRFFLVVVGFYYMTNPIETRFDFTNNGRYTLDKRTIAWMKTIDQSLLVEVYLSGALPPNFKRLQREAKHFLSGLKSINPRIDFRFVTPQNIKAHVKKGRIPTQITVNEEEGVVKQITVLPWALVRYKGKEINMHLLKEMVPVGTNQITASITALPYAIIKGIRSVAVPKTKKIAVLKGHQEVSEQQQYDFLKGLTVQYRLAPFTLDAVAASPKKTLKMLQRFDLVMVAKPKKPFTEAQKYVLDQYAMGGGKMLWLLDLVHTNIDSLFNTGSTLAYPIDLNLTDLFFRYGVRMRRDLVRDSYAAKIALATGNTGARTNFKSFNWFYHPVVRPLENHLIGNNLSRVKLSFASSMELLKSPTKKNVLLRSSPYCKTTPIPSIISLKNTLQQHIGEKRTPIVFGVLMEGDFVSAYKDRTPPFRLGKPRQKGRTKMVVISDGDLVINGWHNGQPLPLGFDKWTQEFYDNKAFLENTVAYLLSDLELLTLRGQQNALPMLDKKRVKKERFFWQWFNLLGPLILLLLVHLGVHGYRRWRFA